MRTRYSWLPALLICLAWPPNKLNSQEPQLPSQPATLMYQQEKTRPLIDNRRAEPYPTKEAEVKKNIKKWADGAAKGEFEGWDNFQGAEIGTWINANLEDMLTLIMDFLTPNKRYLHTFPQIALIEPIEFQWECGVHYQYPGFEVGTCYWPQFSLNPYCYFIWWETSSLVEYYYPAYKIDISEQLYASQYLIKPIVSVFIPLNEVFYSFAAQIAAITMEMVRYTTLIEGIKYGYDFDFPANEEPIEPNEEAVDQLKDGYDSDKRHSAPSLTKAYGRTYFETLDAMTEDIQWIPHLYKFHFFGMDFPFSLGPEGLGGYWFSKMFPASFVPVSDQKKGKDKWEDKISALLLSGPRRCIKNNKYTEKTPFDLDANIFEPRTLLPSMPEEDGEEDICMDHIGETFPFTDDRRPHITDGTYQAAWKMLKLFQYLFPLDDIDNEGREHGRKKPKDASRHSFVRDIDKWYVLRNEEFKEDQKRAGKQALTIDEMPMVNIEKKDDKLRYDKANVKVAKSSGENTFEIWPLFKGCFHPGGKGKGKEADFIIPYPWRLAFPIPPEPYPWPFWRVPKLKWDYRFY